MILVDSNVLLDIIKRDPNWFSWSKSALANALLQDTVFVNPLIYAELSIMYQTSAQLDQVLNVLGIGRAELPWEAAHLAGQAFVQYRQQQKLAIAGLLHRCPCTNRRVQIANPRCESLPHLFSKRTSNHPGH